jgi:hypothetical protein
MLESTKEATISKKPTVKSEQLVLNILDKKDDALRYSLGKDNMDLVLLCASDGVHAQILGNKLLILNSAYVQKGDTWINSSTIEAPLGFEGNTSQLDFKYRVVDVIEKNAFGEKRTEVTVDVYIDTLKALQYKVLSGIGLESLKINFDLEQLGNYSKEIVLQNAH